MVNHDPHRTQLLRERQCLWLPRAFILHADVFELPEVSCAFAVGLGDGADEHAETGFEGGYGRGLRGAEERVGHVVYHLESSGGILKKYIGWRSMPGIDEEMSMEVLG